MVLFSRGMVYQNYRITLGILYFLLDLQVYVVVIGISSFVLSVRACFVPFCIVHVRLSIEEVWILTDDEHPVFLWAIFIVAIEKLILQLQALGFFSTLRSCIIVNHCGNRQKNSSMLFLAESIEGTIVSGSETLCMVRGLTSTILQFFHGRFCCVSYKISISIEDVKKSSKASEWWQIRGHNASVRQCQQIRVEWNLPGSWRHAVEQIKL